MRGTVSVDNSAPYSRPTAANVTPGAAGQIHFQIVNATATRTPSPTLTPSPTFTASPIPSPICPAAASISGEPLTGEVTPLSSQVTLLPFAVYQSYAFTSAERINELIDMQILPPPTDGPTGLIRLSRWSKVRQLR